MSLADIIQIIIGFLSLIATIAVSFLIYWLQSKHEKEIRDIEEMQKQRELEEKAQIFLMDNEDERDYLPWCIFAANLHRLEKHTRNIYNAYCHCGLELQNEILKQAGFYIKQIEDISWVERCLESLQKDIETNQLGRDYLYDGAKYFHRGYKRYKNEQWIEPPAIFEPINKENKIRKMMNVNSIDISEYVDEYFYYYLNGKMSQKDLKPYPPIDYVWESQNLGYANEIVVCKWMMSLVEVIAIYCEKRKDVSNEICFNEIEYTDAVIETYEDKYYSALQALYNTYELRNILEEELPNAKKKKQKRKARKTR